MVPFCFSRFFLLLLERAYGFWRGGYCSVRMSITRYTVCRSRYSLEFTSSAAAAAASSGSELRLFTYAVFY